MSLPDGLQLFEAGNGGILGLCTLEAPGNPQHWISSLPETDRHYIASISHPGNALKSAVGRWVCKHVAGAIGIAYQGVGRTPHGRPWLEASAASVSISHSGIYAAALLNPTAPCGVDLEEIHDKALRLAPKFLSTQELNLYSLDADKATLLWCLKEAAYKRLGLKGPTLRGHLKVLGIDENTGTALVENTYPGGEPLLPVAFAKLPGAWLGWS
jgi:phosphopantetheinyl transferase